MSEDEDFDELPSISVNASRDQRVFAMPSADVLASQRARDAQLDRELRALLGAGGGEGAAPRARDSGESEAEGTPPPEGAPLAEPARRARPHLAAVLGALPAPRPRFLDDFQHAAECLSPRALETLVDEIAGALSETVAQERRPWANEEALATALWLAAALVWAEPPVPRLRVATALRALLADRCDMRQAEALAQALVAAFPDADARLRLHDALLPDGGGAARALLAAALADHLRLSPPLTEEAAARAARARWRGADADAQLALVRLVGRALACGLLRRPVLEALAPGGGASPAANSLEPLKVLLELAELRCLFTGEGGHA